MLVFLFPFDQKLWGVPRRMVLFYYIYIKKKYVHALQGLNITNEKGEERHCKECNPTNLIKQPKLGFALNCTIR
jgi:hypothetical protein